VFLLKGRRPVPAGQWRRRRQVASWARRRQRTGSRPVGPPGRTAARQGQTARPAAPCPDAAPAQPGPSRAAAAASRLAARLAGIVAVAGILLAVAAPAASAHATLLFTSPADGSAVAASPAVITLTFNENVSFTGTPVKLAGAGGHQLGLGAPRLSQGRSVLAVPVAGRLPDGVYTVTWQVTSADGDLVGSQSRFAVGPAPASLSSTAATPESSPGQWPTAALRWLLFAGLAVALGGIAGRALAAWSRAGARAAGTSPAAGPPPAPWALRGALLGAVASAGLAVLDAGGRQPCLRAGAFLGAAAAVRQCRRGHRRRVRGVRCRRRAGPAPQAGLGGAAAAGGGRRRGGCAPTRRTWCRPAARC